MNIGIYLGQELSKDSGGAYSLIQTIIHDIKNPNNTHVKSIEEFCYYIFYIDKNATYKTQENGIVYININKVSIPKTRTTLLQKTKAILKKINGYKQATPEPICNLNYTAKLEKIDIIYFPMPCFYTKISLPFICTVWDLGHRMTPCFPEVSRNNANTLYNLNEWEWRESNYTTVLPKAAYIITGNKTGKDEILANYKIEESKIRIAQFPVARFCYDKESPPDFTLPKDYFFYPATFWSHKNHIVILNALVLLKQQYNLTPTVFFTGSDKGNLPYIKSKIQELNLGKQIYITGFLTEEQLKYLYTHAVAMIFPSLMGPNNMPPIEATFLHCPVIISDIKGHREQLKDTALYFNGYKPLELCEHMKTLLTISSIRDTLIQKQLVLAKIFANINYFDQIKSILNEFALIRKTWGSDYETYK